MERFAIACLGIALVFTSVVNVVQDYRIKNMEQSLKRVEYGYQTIAAENEQLWRINEQNIRLLSEGGWDGFPDNVTGSRTGDRDGGHGSVLHN